MNNGNSLPLVSVIIPTYGRPEFITRCIDSALNQTYPNIEVIVVDDNNPDTPERAETEKSMEIYSSNPKVKYLKHEKNKNGSAARNTGIRAASGEYLAFLDDDDEVMPERFEKCINKLESMDDSYGMVYTGYIIQKPNGESEKSSEKRNGDCYLYALMRTFFICAGSNLLIKKSIADEINGFDESFRRNQDIEFLARALEHYKIAYVDEYLLKINQKGTRTKRTYEQVDSCATFFLEKFTPRLNKLDKKDRQRVISVVSLERFRVALFRKKPVRGFKILIENHVSPVYFMRYVRYLTKRVATKSATGFDGT